MNIGITGVSGFIGREIAKQALGRGWRVVGFTRDVTRRVAFTAELREFDVHHPPDVSGLDAVIHLAGESILGYWTDNKKREIRSSRVLGTMAVVQALRSSPKPPGVLVSCSATGIYGDTGHTIVDEHSPIGSGFLADVASEWEDAAVEAESAGTRVVRVRVGFVLGATGGAMRLMRPVFRAGLGGRLGSGKQWMSLIHVEDLASMFLTAAQDAAWSGPVNAVMPEPVTNAEFTRIVAHCARRPAWMHVPAAVFKVIAGEASQLALSSTRALPRRAAEWGVALRYPDATRAVAACFP